MHVRLNKQTYKDTNHNSGSRKQTINCMPRYFSTLKSTHIHTHNQTNQPTSNDLTNLSEHQHHRRQRLGINERKSFGKNKIYIHFNSECNAKQNIVNFFNIGNAKQQFLYKKHTIT